MNTHFRSLVAEMLHTFNDEQMDILEKCSNKDFFNQYFEFADKIALLLETDDYEKLEDQIYKIELWNNEANLIFQLLEKQNQLTQTYKHTFAKLKEFNVIEFSILNKYQNYIDEIKDYLKQRNYEMAKFIINLCNDELNLDLRIESDILVQEQQKLINKLNFYKEVVIETDEFVVNSSSFFDYEYYLTIIDFILECINDRKVALAKQLSFELKQLLNVRIIFYNELSKIKDIDQTKIDQFIKKFNWLDTSNILLTERIKSLNNKIIKHGRT